MEGSLFGKIFINLLYLPFVSMMIYLKMDREVIMLFSILLLLDMITGVGKTIKIGEKPKSWRFANGLISKMVLIIIPFALALTAKALKIDIHLLVWVVLDSLILSEAYSILGNIYTIRTGKQTEEYDVVSLILRKIRTLLNRLLGDEDEEYTKSKR